MSEPALPEPGHPDDARPGGIADWCHRSVEAATARQRINSMYANFPDRNGKVLSRLRGTHATNFLQALDELHAHTFLAESGCEIRYEETDDSPDFTVYRESDYMAAVEVGTLFPGKSFTSELSRNSWLVDEINSRVKSTDWYVGIRDLRWTSQPRVREIAAWLKDTIAGLPQPDGEPLAPDHPTRQYSSPEVELKFTFFPREGQSAADTGDIVALGPPIFQFSACDTRLRRVLRQKSGSAYYLRDQPYAIFISLRDWCDTEDLVNALYGDEAITFKLDRPGSARPIRRPNGYFTISRNNPEGRNRRVSCVFALMRGWEPRGGPPSTLIRLDNPAPLYPFPQGLIAADRHFAAQRDAASIRMEWYSAH